MNVPFVLAELAGERLDATEHAFVREMMHEWQDRERLSPQDERELQSLAQTYGVDLG